MFNLKTAVSSLLFTLTACGGGSGGGSGSGIPSATSPSVIPQEAPATALVSEVDSSLTVQAVGSGLNPNNRLISTRFHCFDQNQIDLSEALFFVDVNGDFATLVSPNDTISLSIQQNTGPGRIVFVESNLEESALNLTFNEFGQTLNAVSRDETLEGCYQDGAALEAAMHRYRLNTPDTGTYQCEANNAAGFQSIELLDGNLYSAGTLSNSYVVQSATTNNSSVVSLNNSPTTAAEATYFEDLSTGLQTLTIDPSTETPTTCTRQSEPKPFKRYGAFSAPDPTAPAQALSGLHFIDTRILTARVREDNASYVDLRSNGYLRFGVFPPEGNACDLTYPNGLPFCEQYQFDGQTLSVIKPWGEVVSMSAERSRNGMLQLYGEYPVEPLSDVNPASMIGTWVSQHASISNAAACAVGNCSTSITDREFIFSADGQFESTVMGDTSDFLDAGSIVTLTNGSNFEELSGTYTVEGNIIQLTSLEGRLIEELPVFITSQGDLAVGDILYSRP